MKTGRLWIFICALLCLSGTSLGQNGEILEQEVDSRGDGYTVLRVWGSYYDMGYAQGYLLADEVTSMVGGFKALAGQRYSSLIPQIEDSYIPTGMSDEIDGMVDGLKAARPSSTVTRGDLLVLNAYGDWTYTYSCRSHSCWGSYVEAPVKTLSTRRLDYGAQFFDRAGIYHHVVVAYDASDGVDWVNFAMPGMIVALTSVTEEGTMVSIHDAPTTGGAKGQGASIITRTAALRHMVNVEGLPDDRSQRADYMLNSLQQYVPWTGGYLNYYVPEGNGGVFRVAASGNMWQLRKPQSSYFSGDVILTTNSDTDGRSRPLDDSEMHYYYQQGGKKTIADHWGALDSVGTGGNGLYMMSVEYRGDEDMTIWMRGRLRGSTTTPTIKMEWSELFESSGACGAGDLNCDGLVDIFDLVLVAQNFGLTSGFDERADTNDDGLVDIFDLVIVAQNFG